MHPYPLLAIGNARFRANPRFELIPYDRLPPPQHAVLARLREDPDFFGVLTPRAGGATTKTVDRDTAQLLLDLQQPGPLPVYVARVLNDAMQQSIARLVLDEVLEIEGQDGFVSGAAAYHLICALPPPSGAGRTASLSIAALKYADALAIDDPVQLSLRMYCYNRLPQTSAWRCRLPSADSIPTFLGIAPGDVNSSRLARYWTSARDDASGDGWYVWHARREYRDPRRSTCKLYISPSVEALPEVFRAAVEVFSGLEVPCFKIGRTLSGLMRPDKLVAYFETFEELATAGDWLGNTLKGTPVHGVPFTAELQGEGLLSWGADPPDDLRSPLWQARESWRLWVTNRLASALLIARSSPSATVEPWQFALLRLQMDGVDTATWAPPRLGSATLQA